MIQKRCVLKSVVMEHDFLTQAFYSLFSWVIRKCFLVQVHMYTCTCTTIYTSNLIGNHTFAAIRGTESYSLLALLTDISEINSLLKEPLLDGKRLGVVFGGDYKIYIMLTIIANISICFLFSFSLISSIHGHECCSFHICLLVVHCIIC